MSQKDVWDKLDILFKMLAALIVAGVGIVASIYLDDKQETDAKFHLYAELMSNRERADSDLRKEMFNTIIKAFLEKQSGGIQERMLALEMLTYNFHDIIAVGPLFKQLERDILEHAEIKQQPEIQQQLQNRLRSMAWVIVDKQLAALRDSGAITYQDVYFEDLKNSLSGITILDGELSLPAGRDRAERTKFVVQILKQDEQARQFQVHLIAFRPGIREPEIDNTFWVGFSDFPLIDNTRLKNGNRVAIVLRRWEESSAELSVAYFPGSRASLRDKMYYDEVVKELLPTAK